MQQSFKVIGLILLSLVVVACSANLDVNLEDGDIVVNSNFSLSEELLNSGDNTMLSFNNVNLIENANYNIQDGQLVVDGDILCEGGSRQEGSISFEIAATEDGFIMVELDEVQSDCDGVETSLIDEAREELASSLAEAARELQESDATLTFTEVTLADDAINIAFELRAPINSD